MFRHFYWKTINYFQENVCLVSAEISEIVFFKLYLSIRSFELINIDLDRNRYIKKNVLIFYVLVYAGAVPFTKYPDESVETGK